MDQFLDPETDIMGERNYIEIKAMSAQPTELEFDWAGLSWAWQHLFTILFRFIVWPVKAISYAMYKQVFSIQGEKRWILGISLRRPRRGLLT